MARHLINYLFLTALVILSACRSTPSTLPPTLSANIERVNWSIGNIPANFWQGGSGPAVVLNLYVYLESTVLEATDIKSISIRNSIDETRSWSYEASDIPINFFILDDEKKYLKLENIYSSAISDNSSVLFLGTYTVTVELQSGESDTEEIKMTAPNSLEAGSYRYTYSTEDYDGTPPNDYVALPKRANVTARLNPANSVLTINFSVDDERVYSGWVNFYNQEGVFLGQLGGYFRDFSDGSIHPKLNTGDSFNTSGAENTLKVNLGDLDKAANDFKLSDIAKVFVALSDGKQHENGAKRFNFYSYSLGVLD
jgi:hypothetical protein